MPSPPVVHGPTLSLSKNCYTLISVDIQGETKSEKRPRRQKPVVETKQSAEGEVKDRKEEQAATPEMPRERRGASRNNIRRETRRRLRSLMTYLEMARGCCEMNTRVSKSL